MHPHRGIHRNKCVYTYMSLYTSIAYFCLWEESTSKDTPQAMRTPGTVILVSKYHYPSPKKQDSLEK